MTEKALPPQPDERFGDIEQNRFLQFGTEIHVPGDPERPDDFARAHSYLERITEDSLQAGTLWSLNPATIIAELDYQNAWHKYEIEQERRGGETTAEYSEITLRNLRALSWRRIRAFEATGWEVTHEYRVVNFIDHQIAEAVKEQEELEKQMALNQGKGEPFTPLVNLSDEVPF